MAQVEPLSFGAELKDGYKPVDNWVTNGIAWLEEIQEFYRERSAIEKEYSAKLTALARKYHDKKAKKSSSLSVGDNPALTPGSLESASLTTWTTHLSTLEARAVEHAKFGQELINQVVMPLEYNQKRFDDLRRSHAEYQSKLLKERDATYGDLKKLKTKYDTACQDVENRRKKTDSSFDHGKTKAANAYNQQLIEMHNVKNTYLIGINVTNKLKECYYHEYVPDLLDSLQDLAETRVAKLNGIWSVASSLESITLKTSTDHMTRLSNEIQRNVPVLDSTMFVRHNAVQWQEPGNMSFEPSPVWLDSDGMAVDETAKIFLRNILSKSKPLIGELQTQASQKRRELDNVKRARQNIRDGKDKRDEVDCVKSQFAVQEELHAIDRNRMTAEVETSTITSVVGDISVYGKNHSFKSETIRIPTNCDLCGDRIWGLNPKGFICTECGYTCHSKCQMRVPADCPGEQTKEEKKRLKVERQAAAQEAVEVPASNGTADVPTLTRQDTMNTLSSGYAASATRSLSGNIPRSINAANTSPAQSTEDLNPPSISTPLASTPSTTATPTNTVRRNRIVAPPPAAYVGAPANDAPPDAGQNRGRMTYAYEARDEGEVSVAEGKEVTIVEPDDGGWTRIHAGLGQEGLVPTSYIEQLPASASLAQIRSPSPLPTSDRPASTYSNSSASLAGSVNALSLKKKGPAVAPKRGAKKLKYVEALYSYTAQSDAEFDMVEGEKFVLVSMGSGDGWADVEKGGETKSVPANYIQEI